MNRYGGCGGKVDYLVLRGLLEASGIAEVGEPFFDAHVTALPGHPGSRIAISSDLIYDMGVSASDLGYASVVHAASDIFAVLGAPHLFTLTLGATSADLSSGRATEILAGAREACTLLGGSLAGGHTARSSQTFVAVTAIGVVEGQPHTPAMEPETYELMLSKPIGVGVLIAARMNSLGSEDVYTTISRHLHADNAAASSALLSLVRSAPEAVGFVTDVTGYGLLLALHMCLRPGYAAAVDFNRVPIMPGAEDMVRHEAMGTALGERNMFAFESLHGATSQVDRASALLINDPQTCGGLLAAVKTSDVDRLIEAQPTVSWQAIGQLSVESDMAEPTISIRNGG